jgi:hypothetical protein
VPKVAWHCCGDSSVANGSLRGTGQRCKFAFRPHGAPRVVTVHLPDFCGTNMNHMNSIEKMAKAIKKLCNTDFSTDSRICGRCHVTTETASHILRERVASADLRFRRLGKHFMEQSYYDDIPLRSLRYCTLLEVRANRWNKANGEAQ